MYYNLQYDHVEYNRAAPETWVDTLPKTSFPFEGSTNRNMNYSAYFKGLLHRDSEWN